MYHIKKYIGYYTYYVLQYSYIFNYDNIFYVTLPYYVVLKQEALQKKIV